MQYEWIQNDAIWKSKWIPILPDLPVETTKLAKILYAFIELDFNFECTKCTDVAKMQKLPAVQPLDHNSDSSPSLKSVAVLQLLIISQPFISQKKTHKRCH